MGGLVRYARIVYDTRPEFVRDISKGRLLIKPQGGRVLLSLFKKDSSKFQLEFVDLNGIYNKAVKKDVKAIKELAEMELQEQFEKHENLYKKALVRLKELAANFKYNGKETFGKIYPSDKANLGFLPIKMPDDSLKQFNMKLVTELSIS
jgi:hypothetical protein